MTALDKALHNFWIWNDGKQATRIYLGHNIIIEIRKTMPQCFELDIVNKTYRGIPYYIVLHDNDHLAIY